jgi:hypothetical protein
MTALTGHFFIDITIRKCIALCAMRADCHYHMRYDCYPSFEGKRFHGLFHGLFRFYFSVQLRELKIATSTIQCFGMIDNTTVGTEFRFFPDEIPTAFFTT